MSTLAQHGDNTAEGRCRWCGRKLYRSQRRPDGRIGVNGDGFFCTNRCGYIFGRKCAMDGIVVRLKRSAAAATLFLFFTVAAGCGSVDQQGAGGAGGDVAADSGAGGAAGRDTGGSAGGVFGAGGNAGGSAAGTAGAAGGRDVDAGAAGAPGGASTAPACRGTFVGATPDRVCPQIAGTPQHPGGWQCEVDCSSSAADNAGGCIFSGVTYCVSSCAACVP